HAQSGQGDMAQAHDSSAERCVSAPEILLMKEKSQARARYECDQEKSPTGVPIPDMTGGGHRSRFPCDCQNRSMCPGTLKRTGVTRNVALLGDLYSRSNAFCWT